MIPQIDAKVLRAELEDIERRRNLVFRPDGPSVTTMPGQPAEVVTPAADAEPQERLTQIDAFFERAHRVRPFGIAFSGGGIRSATFNLGVLQGLANKRLLPYVDYLSTVSGGGYIGSWLHGLILNHCKGDVRDAEAILSSARNTVPASPEFDPVTFLRKYSNYLAPRPGLFSVDTWVIGSIWLRNVLLNQLILLPTLGALILLVLFAGFLSQRRISEDVANLQSVLAVAPLILAMLISAVNLRGIVKQTTPVPPMAPAWLRKPWDAFTRWALGAGQLAAVSTFVAAVMIAVKGQPERAKVEAANTVAALWGEIPSLSVDNESARIVSLVAIPLLFLALQVIGGFPECYQRLRKRPDGSITMASRVLSYLHVLWMTPVTSIVTASLIYVVVTKLPIATTTIGAGAWIRIGFGPPLVSACILAGGSLLVGVMGGDYPDGGREWLARVGALIGLCATAWLGLFIIAVYGPYLVAWTLSNYAVLGVSAIAGWALTTGLGVIAGRSARTNGGDGHDSGGGSFALNTIIAIAPTVFMIGYLLMLSTLIHVVVRHLNPAPYPASAWQPQASGSTRYNVDFGGTPTQVNVQVTPTDSSLGPRLGSIVTFQQNYWDVLSSAHWTLFVPDPTPGLPWSEAIRRLTLQSGTRATLAVGLLCLVIAGIASWRFNINEFSLHHFYKNRLVRCYLGASHTKERKPDRLTGFDPRDDFPLSALVPDAPTPYGGPYAIVNAALNLNAGSELAQQERKSTAFVFTPRFCGFQPLGSRIEREVESTHELDASGYRDTAARAGIDAPGFMYPDGPRLGTVTAISGAAANPNAGYHTSGPMAFLLTVFDARLGWWVGNPRNTVTSPTSGPRWAWRYLFAELLGQTTSRSHYVNLSDGGHFENLGLYELVRRRCRYIIVGDAEEDAQMTFESLGGAIRKCRADFGVEIEIDPQPIALGTDGRSHAHCVVGTISYPEQDREPAPGLCEGAFAPAADTNAHGWLLYLKSSLTGDEPSDITQYHAANTAFPQQSTGDQFFSESQFESYRRLGLHVVSDAFDRIDAPAQTGDSATMQALFQQLARKWYGPIAATGPEAARLASAYTSFMQRIGARTPTGAFEREFLPEVAGATAPAAATEIGTDEIVLGLEAIQLMEDVFGGFGLELQANRMNPRNAGWMALFRRWARPETVLITQIWPGVKTYYNPMFQTFVDVDLRHDASRDWPERP
jgi:hypothetical protein